MRYYYGYIYEVDGDNVQIHVDREFNTSINISAKIYSKNKNLLGVGVKYDIITGNIHLRNRFPRKKKKLMKKLLRKQIQLLRL